MGGSPSVSQPAVPTPTAPATPNNAASLAVEQATYRQQLRRKSIATTITPQAAPPVTNFSKTNGKVFFHNQTDGKDYVCSGSSINSDSKRLVVTAGHCVYGAPGNDGAGGFARN